LEKQGEYKMKKNLSILFVVVLGLGLLLSACGGDDTGSSVDSSNYGALAGAWENDNDNTVGIAFGDDGTYGIYKSGELLADGTYTFDGSTLTLASSDGSESSAQVEINGGAMTWTDPDGSVSGWTKK
jgi:major membrane immunogen (membrane-anchored lipoprotein)